MHRINTATKAVDLFGAGKHGFKNGNLALGIPPTDLDAEWFNAVQEELMALLEAAGVIPDTASRNQVLNLLRGNAFFETTSTSDNSRKVATTAFVQALLAANPGVPTGGVGYFAMSTAPAGWLKANGAAISRTTYAALFSAIGTTYGAGDGATTFNIPDARGEFLRAWSDGSSVDAGRVLGSKQAATGIGTHVDPSSGVVSYTQADSIDAVALNYFSIGGATTTGSWIRVKPRNIAFLACIKF